MVSHLTSIKEDNICEVNREKEKFSVNMDIFDASFYWGRITRQTAEEVLKKADLNDGLYLVREKLEEAGIYVISLCFSKR